MRTIKAVLWDMDGTLVDSEHIAVEALRQAMIEAGLRVPADLHDRAAGRAADDLYRWLARDFGLVADPALWEMRKLHHYVAGSTALRGFEPAIATWHRLAKAGIAQAVVSNSDRTIVDINLRSVGLMRPALVTVSRNDVRRGKPDPEGYRRAAWLLGADPEECLIVEDSTSGAAAALASGIRTVFVPHSTVAVPMGVIGLTDMGELEEMALGPAEVGALT